MLVLSNPLKFKLCMKRGCCPEVTIEGEKVTITDDYDGKIEITTEDLEILVSKVQELQKK